MGLILFASIVLVLTLIIASIIDYKTHHVPNWLWLIVGVMCLLIMMQSTVDADTSEKTLIVILTIAYIIGTYVMGKVYFDAGYYGGADVKFAMVVGVLLASMGFIGSLFYFWFLILNPLIIFIGTRFASKEKLSHALNEKTAFIPYMTFIFLGICLMHILTVN